MVLTNLETLFDDNSHNNNEQSHDHACKCQETNGPAGSTSASFSFLFISHRAVCGFIKAFLEKLELDYWTNFRSACAFWGQKKGERVVMLINFGSTKNLRKKSVPTCSLYFKKNFKKKHTASLALFVLASEHSSLLPPDTTIAWRGSLQGWPLK